MCLVWLIVYYSLGVILPQVRGHIPVFVTTPANRIEQFCSLAEACVHDTIPICGKNGESVRSFLDLCDLLEYACDTGDIFIHIEDQPNCPVLKGKQSSNL